jgi:rhamnose transport system permease protein
MRRLLDRLKSWEGFLLAILIVIVLFNIFKTPHYLQVQNQINLFQLHIEKIIVVVIMTFIIINAEIDLSVASVMGLAGCTTAYLFELGVPFGVCLLAGLSIGVLAGVINGFMVAYVGLTSLIVTLAGLIGFRGLAHVLLENRSVGNFPEWFNRLGQDPLIGPFPLAMIVFCLYNRALLSCNGLALVAMFTLLGITARWRAILESMCAG